MAVHPDFETEQEKIDFAYDCLDSMVRKYGALPGGAAHPKVAHVFEKMSKRALDRLSSQDQLCLGRIDASGEAPLYIGRCAVQDEKSNLVLANWQAPAAARFWSATPTEPRGLLGKRAFLTEERRLLDIYEDRFDGAEIAPLQAPPGIDDLLLAELERDRGEQMRDIVATIRDDQYRLMAAPLDEVLVIQGGPGTGKTAVGLHRASWLLFNHRDELEKAGLLLVGPNRVFMHYVAGVLPSLGDETIDQSAVQYLVSGVRARAEDTPDVARLKGDATMAAVVANEILGRIRVPDESPTLTLEQRPVQVPIDDIASFLENANRAQTPYMQRRRVFLDRLRDAFFDAANEGGRLNRSREDFVYSLNQRADFRTVGERIWPRLSATQAIRELLGSRDRLSRAGGDLMPKEQLDLLYRRNPDKEEEVLWTEHDLPLVDEAESVLNGVEETYGHVIVDEAQDLTPMQLRMVGRRLRSGSMTILGDIAQAMGVYAYSSWDEITQHVGWGEGRVEELHHAYRVPRQIVEFASPTLRQIAPALADPIPFRDGRAPDVREVARQFLGDEVAFEAQAGLELGGSVGVIAPDSLLQEIRAGLDDASLDYREASRGDLGGGVELLTPRMTKGLEFDHVVLVEPLAILRESAAAAPLRELYVPSPALRGLSLSCTLSRCQPCWAATRRSRSLNAIVRRSLTQHQRSPSPSNSHPGSQMPFHMRASSAVATRRPHVESSAASL